MLCYQTSYSFYQLGSVVLTTSNWLMRSETTRCSSLITEVELRTQGSRRRPRTQKKSEAKAKDRNAQGQGHKCKCFPKKKGLKIFFSLDLQKKNGLEKHFSADLQNFNHSKNSAVLEPRTGQFSRTWGFEAKAKDLKMCSRGQGRPRGLHLCLIIVMAALL